MVVPCDAKVLHCGVITDENQVEQVKGMTYALNEFLGGSHNDLPVKEGVSFIFEHFLHLISSGMPELVVLVVLVVL